MAAGMGESDAPVRVDAPVTGASVLPPSPLHARLDAATGALHWALRSRAGWGWIDGRDAPLAEESEAYRLVFADGSSVETIAPQADIPSEAALPLALRQRGTNGLSPAAVIG